ncbi:saccharopine dehydrogenase NADP-binding domain-containing protein [Lacrimispora brassicae]
MIGVIGGYGNIGREVVKLLTERGYKGITVGSRRQNLEDPISWSYVNIEEEESLFHFMNRHSIVINTAGPSSLLSLKAAECALKAGCHYIDCGYNREVTRLSVKDTSQCILYNMGSIPGFSEILPLVFREDFTQVERFRHFYSITGKFTRTAAIDFIAGVFSGNGGMTLPAAGKIPELDGLQPFYKNAERILPYENADTAQIQEIMKSPEAQWYHVICGSNINAFYKDLLKKYFQGREKLAAELCLAAERDHILIPSQVTFLLEMEGINREGEPQKNLYYLQAPGQSKLSAAFCTAVCECLLEGSIEPGIGWIEKLTDPAAVFGKVKQYGLLSLKKIVNAALEEKEEGVL